MGKATVALQTIIFLSGTYDKAKLRQSTASEDGDSVKLVLSLQNLASMLRMLTMVDNETMSQVIPNTDTTLGSQGKLIMERFFQMYPNIAFITNYSSSNTTDEIEAAANAYFAKLYTSEESAREVVQMLKRFQSSESSHKNDIFSCMIHNLFDEYRFFSIYPEKKLRITGILFGLLIKEKLVSSMTLGLALRYVLASLLKSPNKVWRVERCSDLGCLPSSNSWLLEWPQYFSHLVQIGHLREENADAALFGEIETALHEPEPEAPTVPALPSVISSLPVHQLVHPQEDLPEEMRTFAICLDDFKVGERRKCLPCSHGHGFHQKCIDQWLGLNGVCPICRTPVQIR